MKDKKTENCRETAAAATTLRRLWSYRSRLICIHNGGWLFAIGPCQSSLPWRIAKGTWCMLLQLLFSRDARPRNFFSPLLQGKCTGNLHVDSLQKINQYEVVVSSWIISYSHAYNTSIYLIGEDLRPQHFYNKSQVISSYWFKFEPNTKITFLPQ